MLFSETQDKANKVLYNEIPYELKSVIATSIFTANRMAKKIWEKNCNLPKIGKYDAAFRLRFIIYRLLAKFADEKMGYGLTYTETSGTNSPLYIWNGRIQFQLKKHINNKTVPAASLDRLKKSQKNEQGSLFDDEEISEWYCIVTYDHKDFMIKHISMGIPNAQYNGWLAFEDIARYVDIDEAEEIEKHYLADMESAVEEEISKTYKLEISK